MTSPLRVLVGLRRLATATVLPRSWDGMIRFCAMTAVLSMLVALVMPGAAELAVFAWLIAVANGPTSTLVPSASEPVLMVFGTLYSPWVLASIGTAAVALAEWVNYRIFGAVLLDRRMASVRSARITRHVRRCFDRSPFVTSVVTALTPIPLWMARICAVISRYSVRRFILATAVGRFPRLWLFAFLGTALPFGPAVILLGGAVVMMVGITWAVARRPGRIAVPPPFPTPCPRRVGSR